MMASSFCFSGSRSPGFPYFSLMRSRPIRAAQCLGRRFAKHLPRNNRVQHLQRVTSHRPSPVPAKIQLIKALIEHEGTIRYEA